MATNQDGHLLDTAGNVAVDFVWGNFPLQPNDVRRDNGGTNLDYTKDNHVIAETGWNGYPQYTPNDDGAFISGTAYAIVPNVLGQATADAVDTLTDSEFTITTAAGATNANKSITNIARTAGNAEVTITATGATAAYPVGTKITIASTGTVDGTWTVTGNASTNQVKFTSNATTVLSSGTGVVFGTPATIKTQSIAAGAGSIAVGAAITITPWAANS
jgi:hypothetical protein